MDTAAEPSLRTLHLKQGLRLEYLTIGWNIIEGIIAVGAALSAGSVALLGFGIDSFIESLSGGVLVWRLRAERMHRDAAVIEALDQRAHKLVAYSLFLLGSYILIDAFSTLWHRERPNISIVGIVLTLISVIVMQWLARAKRRVAMRLESRAMAADAFQTTACFWLSVTALLGIGLNAAFGWWWADPAAAIGMAFFISREGLEAWRGEECCGSACASSDRGCEG